MSTLLLPAADIIQANGFIGDDYFEGDDYQPGMPCRVCPRAAVAIAKGRHPLYVESWPLRCVDIATPTDEEIAAYEEIVAAEAAFARYLREELGYRFDGGDAELIESWAEQDGRTQPQVVGAMRAAAEYAGRPA